jgi:hypothetical protein
MPSLESKKVGFDKDPFDIIIFEKLILLKYSQFSLSWNVNVTASRFGSFNIVKFLI